MDEEKRMAPALCSAIASQYHLALHPVRQLSGGEESEVWLTISDDGTFVVRINPPRRSLAQLMWTHQLMLSLRPLLPAVIAPLRATDGSTLFLYNEHPIALFPFVEGHHLDREQSSQRLAAARLLAQLHNVMLTIFPATGDHITRGVVQASHLPHIEYPDFLKDPELDAWNAALMQQPTSYTYGAIHGDYYRRNLLVRDGMIVALLDWDDAHTDFLMQEVAWSAWEFCKASSRDNWHPERVRAYLQTYRDAGGPCKEEEYAELVPFIRWRLREEIRHHLATEAAGQNGAPEYVNEILRAFQRFRGYALAL
jgi:Ser/Thr protein kinase RdoA (MazF antagonist)